MKKVIRKFYPDGVKCGGCNWRVTTLYAFEGEDIDRYGLCANCFLDMIVDEEMKVSLDER